MDRKRKRGDEGMSPALAMSKDCWSIVIDFLSDDDLLWFALACRHFLAAVRVARRPLRTHARSIAASLGRYQWASEQEYIDDMDLEIRMPFWLGQAGTPEVLDHIYPYIGINGITRDIPMRVITQACAADNYRLLEWLQHHGGPELTADARHEICHVATIRGNIPILKWATVDAWKSVMSAVHLWTAMHNQVDVFHWAMANGVSVFVPEILSEALWHDTPDFVIALRSVCSTWNASWQAQVNAKWPDLDLTGIPQCDACERWFPETHLVRCAGNCCWQCRGCRVICPTGECVAPQCHKTKQCRRSLGRKDKVFWRTCPVCHIDKWYRTNSYCQVVGQDACPHPWCVNCEMHVTTAEHWRLDRKS